MTSWGIEYLGVAYQDGGNTLATVTGNGGSGNPKYLIYPDKTFLKWPSSTDLVDAGLKEHIHDGTTYSLTVNSGSGDGDHAKDASVTITADAAPTGKEFDKWTGDTDYLENPNSSPTTVTMPAQDITVTATYKDKGPVVKKDNYMVISSWESEIGEQGSKVTIDSSAKADTILYVSLKLAKSNETEKLYSWAKVSGYADGKFAGVTSVELIYYSNNPVNIVLDQEGLTEVGESYLYSLPADSRGKVTIPISEFTQPSWVADADATPLDLSKVISLSFAAVTEEQTTELEIQGIFLDGFEENTPILNQNYNTSKNMLSVSSLTDKKLTLNNTTKDIFDISIFNAAGKKVISVKRNIDKNGTIEFKNRNLSKGAYIIKVSSETESIVTNKIVK